jgi:hypothetical protein
LLNNALAQTGRQGKTLTGTKWRGQVRDRLRRLDWEEIQTDVRPFVEPGFVLSLLSLENLEQVLGERKTPVRFHQ